MIDLTQYPNPLMNQPLVKITGFKAEAYERFMSDNFKIVDKNQLSVPFNVNPAQHSLNVHMQEYQDILVLKARKMGFSSDALGIGAAKFLMGENEKCVSMSFEQGASEKQLSRVKYYIKSYEEKNSIKIPYKYNSKNQIVREGKTDNGQGGYDYYENILQVGTAGNTSFGRGDDITFLHLTEVSLADLYALMAGVGEACLPNAHKILETTANGYNSYRKFWIDAKKNKNNFAALFYSPLWEYSQEYIDKKYADLGHLGAQEYPMNDRDAFVGSGSPFFDKEAIRKYLDEIEDSDRSPNTLPPHLDSDMFTLHRPLRKGEFICFFVDTAGEGSDMNAGQGLSKTSLDIPITLHYEGSIIDVTPKLKDLLEYIYEHTGVKPVVCYETNNGGGYELDRLNRLNKLQKYTIYYQYKLDSEGRLERTDKMGWNTNSATRPAMLDGVEDLVNNHLVTIYDIRTAEELPSFVKKAKSGGGWRAEADEGENDDHVMSLAGAWQLYQTESPPVIKKSTRKPVKRMKLHL